MNETCKKPGILLLEDDEDIRDFLNGLLISYGCNSYLADSFKKVTKIMSANKINMVLLDIMLPGTDGRDVADFIHKNYPGTSIYFMTGAEQYLEEKHLQLCDGVLSKPFTIEELKNIIFSKTKIPEEISYKKNKRESLELFTSFATEYEALRRQKEKLHEILAGIPELNQNNLKEKLNIIKKEHNASLDHLREILEKAKISLKD